MHSKQATIVELPDGSKADRTKVAFNLAQDERNKNILHATDRRYIRQPDGSLRRVGHKMTRDDRREAKRMRRADKCQKKMSHTN
jgi:hypothetical protein